MGDDRSLSECSASEHSVHDTDCDCDYCEKRCYTCDICSERRHEDEFDKYVWQDVAYCEDCASKFYKHIGMSLCSLAYNGRYESYLQHVGNDRAVALRIAAGIMEHFDLHARDLQQAVSQLKRKRADDADSDSIEESSAAVLIKRRRVSN